MMKHPQRVGIHAETVEALRLDGAHQGKREHTLFVPSTVATDITLTSFRQVFSRNPFP
jgi:hypothetical protein